MRENPALLEYLKTDVFLRKTRDIFLGGYQTFIEKTMVFGKNNIISLKPSRLDFLRNYLFIMQHLHKGLNPQGCAAV